MSKGTVFSKNTDFLPKSADVRKIKRALVLKGLFSETAYVCTYKFQVSSIIWTIFGQEGGGNDPPPHLQTNL